MSCNNIPLKYHIYLRLSLKILRELFLEGWGDSGGLHAGENQIQFIMGSYIQKYIKHIDLPVFIYFS